MSVTPAAPHPRSVFAVLLSERPPQGYALYDVRLVDVRETAGGKVQVVECAGQTVELALHPSTRQADIGRVGYLVPHWEPIDTPGSAFRPYLDQSLRRAVELDAQDPHAEQDGRRPNVVGWSCDAYPEGFRAPAGLVPGLEGEFVPDDSVSLVLRVPRELLRLSRDYQLTSVDLLRSFMADLCELRNLGSAPRADGLSSSGSDERDLAGQWLQRAFGHRLYDEDTRNDLDEENAERELHDPLGEAIADFQDAGGSESEVIAALRSLTAQRQAARKE